MSIIWYYVLNYTKNILRFTSTAQHSTDASGTDTNARLASNYGLRQYGTTATALRAGPMSNAAWVIFIRYMTRDLPADISTNHPAKGTMMSPFEVNVDRIPTIWLSDAKYNMVYKFGEEVMLVCTHITPPPKKKKNHFQVFTKTYYTFLEWFLIFVLIVQLNFILVIFLKSKVFKVTTYFSTRKPISRAVGKN